MAAAVVVVVAEAGVFAAVGAVGVAAVVAPALVAGIPTGRQTWHPVVAVVAAAPVDASVAVVAVATEGKAGTGRDAAVVARVPVRRSAWCSPVASTSLLHYCLKAASSAAAAGAEVVLASWSVASQRMSASAEAAAAGHP